MPNIKSNIEFALVNIPIIINPVIRNNDISFNQLHKKCLNRINYVKYCNYCNIFVDNNEIIKGYKIDNKYITFTNNELNKLKLNNDKTIEVIGFIDIKKIDPIYYEKSYVLTDNLSKKAYNLFINALKISKKVALVKTIISTKFYYGILRIYENNLILTTLYFEEEVYLDNNVNIKSNKKELDLALKLIDELSIEFDYNKLKDEYQENIRKAINDKIKGKKIKSIKKSQSKQVKDLMEALEKSLK